MLAIYVKNKNAKKNHLLRGNEKNFFFENENFSQKKWIWLPQFFSGFHFERTKFPVQK
jgi:hypothetical protein